MVDVQLTGIGVAVVLLGVSLYALATGVRTYRFGSTLAEVMPFDGQSSTGQLTIVEGVVDGPADGEALESGFSGTPCVAYATRKITQKSYGDEDISRAVSGSHRERIRGDHDAVPFLVDADGELIEVDASDARVEISDDGFEEVSTNEVMENRGLLVGLWWLFRDLATTADREVRRHYLEASFRTGDAVRVIGKLANSSSTDGVAIERPDQGPLVVSSASHSDVVDRFRSAGKARIWGGVVICAVAAVVLAAVTGVM